MNRNKRIKWGRAWSQLQVKVAIANHIRVNCEQPYFGTCRTQIQNSPHIFVINDNRIMNIKLGEYSIDYKMKIYPKNSIGNHIHYFWHPHF